MNFKLHMRYIFACEVLMSSCVESLRHVNVSSTVLRKLPIQFCFVLLFFGFVFFFQLRKLFRDLNKHIYLPATNDIKKKVNVMVWPNTLLGDQQKLMLMLNVKKGAYKYKLSVREAFSLDLETRKFKGWFA